MGVESREAGGNGSRGDRDPGDMLTAEEENERSPARQPGWQQHLPGEPEGVGGRADVPATTTVIISAFSGEGVMHRMSAFPTLSVTVTRAVVSGDGGFGRGSGHDREPQ